MRCVCQGAGGELEGGASVTSEGEQRGAPAGDPERPGPFQTPFQHSSRTRQYSDTASLPGEEHTGKSRVLMSTFNPQLLSITAAEGGHY